MPCCSCCARGRPCRGGMNGLFYGDPTTGQINTSDYLAGLGEEINVRVGNQPQLLRMTLQDGKDRSAPRIKAEALKRGAKFRDRGVVQHAVPVPSVSTAKLHRADQRSSVLQLPAPGTPSEFRRRVRNATATARVAASRARRLMRQAEKVQQKAYGVEQEAAAAAARAGGASSLPKQRAWLAQARALEAKAQSLSAHSAALLSTAREEAAISAEQTQAAKLNAGMLQRA